MAVIKKHVPFMISPTVQSNFVHGQHDLNSPLRGDIPECHCIPASTGLPLNESVLPDEFLLRRRPCFLIRHPALAFPSYYRVMLAFMNGDQEKLEAMMNDLAETCTLRWTRNLYDWYTAT
jgi:hypothetical protein